MEIILASKSPRRRQLLAKAMPGYKFMIIGSRISEKRRVQENADEFCRRIARAKARWVIRHNQALLKNDFAVIAADTAISIGKKVIGQPEDKNDARVILQILSGKLHEVITAVVVLSKKKARKARVISFIVKSRVWMKKLTKKMIDDYIKTGEPMDKAGAYAIQGKGRKLIKKYEGSYTNIIGLPVEEMRKALQNTFQNANCEFWIEKKCSGSSGRACSAKEMELPCSGRACWSEAEIPPCGTLQSKEIGYLSSKLDHYNDHYRKLDQRNVVADLGRHVIIDSLSSKLDHYNDDYRIA